MVKTKDASQIKGQLAWVTGEAIWIPVNILQESFNPTISLHQEESRIYLNAGGADGGVLNFPVRYSNNEYYLNVKNLENILNIEYGIAKNDNWLVLQKSRKASLTPTAIIKAQPEKLPPNTKINLVWDHIIKDSPDLSKAETIKGLNVIAPTWFSIVDDTGLVLSKADKKYVTDAHQKGYKVWALISNSFDRDLTHRLLANKDARRHVVEQLQVYGGLYKLDGINIDFENIYDEDKEQLTDFVAELTAGLKQQGLTVSMDVTVPSGATYWSKCYDRKKLGNLVDYLMVMTYDETWSKSRISGSVASLGWVEKGLRNTLLDVPSEKVLMGLPFYTREWEETVDASGHVSAKSRTMSMAAVDKTIQENHLEPLWLEDKGQHYVEYTRDDKRFRIWIEDERSIRLKTGLVAQFKLAGVASWRKGFENKGIWQVIHATLNEAQSGAGNKALSVANGSE